MLRVTESVIGDYYGVGRHVVLDNLINMEKIIGLLCCGWGCSLEYLFTLDQPRLLLSYSLLTMGSN